jgi:hypothetical protein
VPGGERGNVMRGCTFGGLPAGPAQKKKKNKKKKKKKKKKKYSRASASTDSISAVYRGPKKNWKIKDINGS